MARALTPDQRAGRIASRQHGAISRRQALQAGLTSRQIQSRLRSGRWRRAARGVYVLVGTPDTWQQRAMVAVLACPPGSMASHVTAAALFGLVDPPAVPHVTIPAGASGLFGAAVVHRSGVDRRDTCTVAGIRCTKPARTLTDCAGVVGYEVLCDLVDAALCRDLTTVAGVRLAASRASRAPGRKGIPALERALEVWTWGPKPGSPPEMRLARRLQEWGYPTPERQIEILDEQCNFVARVDCGWREWRLGFEYDSDKHHGPRQWNTDDEREARIEALGWRIEPVDKFDLRPSSTRLREFLAQFFGEEAGRAA